MHPHDSKYILHDYWTALVVSKFGKLGYIDEPLVKYRQHFENRVGSKRKSDSINDFEEMRNLFIDVKLDHFKVFKNKLCYSLCFNNVILFTTSIVDSICNMNILYT